MRWTVMMVVMAALMAAGCGKKGDLLPPPGYDGGAPQDTTQK